MSKEAYEALQGILDRYEDIKIWLPRNGAEVQYFREAIGAARDIHEEPDPLERIATALEEGNMKMDYLIEALRNIEMNIRPGVLK